MKSSHRAILPKNLVVLAIFGISTVGSGLPPAVQAQSLTPDQSNGLGSSASDLLKRGQDKFQRQDYRGAILDFEQAIIQEPNNANIYFNRGLVLQELGDELGALWDFEDTIVRNPRHARAYFHRAGLRLSLGYRSGAMQDLRTAAQMFAQQGDSIRYQKAQNLLRNFDITY
jgi:tetratricopeptide (TPR) repeat protein